MPDATDEPVLRWGIAGPGGIAARMADALATLPDAELVAVGSRSSERAAAFAATHRVPHVHASYEALFADPDVDIVYVATPHSTHHDLTVAALEAGRHVVCEKAFALDAAQAAHMVEVARRTRRFLMEAMWTWFLPPVVEARRRLAAGAVGEARVLRADFGGRIPPDRARLWEPALGGGALLDLGIYAVALARFLLGPPDAVRAVGHLAPSGVDDNLGAVLGHPDGAVALFHAGLGARTTQTAEITGSDGVLTLHAPFWGATAFTVDRHDERPETVTVPHHGLAHEAAHAMARIRGGHLDSDVVPLEDSVAMMATLDTVRAEIGLRFPHED